MANYLSIGPEAKTHWGKFSLTFNIIKIMNKKNKNQNAKTNVFTVGKKL